MDHVLPTEISTVNIFQKFGKFRNKLRKKLNAQKFVARFLIDLEPFDEQPRIHRGGEDTCEHAEFFKLM